MPVQNVKVRITTNHLKGLTIVRGLKLQVAPATTAVQSLILNQVKPTS